MDQKTIEQVDERNVVIYRYRFLMLCLGFLCLFGSIVPGQRAQAKDSTLHIDIYGPGQKEVNVFVATPRPLASGANNQTSTPQSVLTLNELLINNFGFLPFLEQVANDDILGKNDCEGIISSDIDFKRFKLSQVDLLVTCGWKIKDGNRPHVELRVFDVFTQKLLLGRGYLIPKEEQMYRVANRFCAGLMDTLTGKSGFFTSEIAFVKKSHQNKEIFISTPQGYERRQLTSFQEICLSPAWSWDASSLAFTYVNKDKHELVLWNRATKKLQHIYLPGNTIISPAFRPGNSLAISVDPNGNPDIYLLDSKWHLDRHIIQNWAIDISPDFDRTGKNMVFVSSRLGNPHIFLNDMDTEEVSRISYEGTYNTNPSISPNGRYVAYSRLTDTGHRIIVYDRKKDVEQQITFGPGDDEDPAWCPDSYFLAFASSRSGAYQLYVTTRQGEFLRKIPTGSGVAKSPAWSPVLSAE